MRTFDIIKEYYALQDLIEAELENPSFDPTTGEVIPIEEILKEEIGNLQGAKEEKLENIEYLKRDNKSKIEALNEEIKRLQNRKKSLEKTNENLSNLQNILLAGEKLKTTKFTFSYRKSKSVEIKELDLIPDDYKKVTYTADKTKIKKAIEAGEFIQGAEIVEKKSLSVR